MVPRSLLIRAGLASEFIDNIANRTSSRSARRSGVCKEGSLVPDSIIEIADA